MVNSILAITPEPMALLFSPKTKRMIPPEIALAEALLDAAAAAAPVVVEPQTREEENVKLNWRELTAVAPAVNPIGTATVAPGNPETEPTPMPADCAMTFRPESIAQQIMTGSSFEKMRFIECNFIKNLEVLESSSLEVCVSLLIISSSLNQG